jgi:hypothetical protein
MAQYEWQPIDTLPKPGYRPGKVFVVVEGTEYHSGLGWYRQSAGLARTHNEGFYAEDIAKIEKEDWMEPGSGVVTHWMPYRLPRLPVRS